MKSYFILFQVAEKLDSVKHVSIETDDDNTIMIWRIQEHFHLMVQVDADARHPKELIEESLEILEQSKFIHDKPLNFL